MKIRITATYSPDLGDPTVWPGCKTAQDACDQLRSAITSVLSALNIKAVQLEVVEVSAIEPGGPSA